MVTRAQLRDALRESDRSEGRFIGAGEVSAEVFTALSGGGDPPLKYRAAQLVRDHISKMRDELAAKVAAPIPMRLTCPLPDCGRLHVDSGEFATKIHHTHTCQFCGHTWRPAVVATVGVQFLPGFKDADSVTVSAPLPEGTPIRFVDGRWR